MKKLLLIFSLTIVSLTIFAQTSIIQPNVFQLAITSTYNCPTGNKGKIYFDPIYNGVIFCTGVGLATSAYSPWQGLSNSYYMGGFVGIRQGTPAYNLDVNSHGRFSNTLFVNTKLGINTLTPTEKLEIVDREMTIKNTADATFWRFRYRDASDRFELFESINNATSGIFVNNGGNAGLGGVASATNKLNVVGDAYFNSDVTVGGYGIIANTDAAQLKLYTSIYTTGSTFGLSTNGCTTIPQGIAFPNGTFSTTPAVSVGNKISGINTDERITITIESVAINTASIRFCNSSSSSVGLNSMSYAIIAIGQ